jgi:transposase
MNPTPHNWKEARRFQAWRLTHKGWSQRQIAAALGVREAAVRPWLQRVRDGGVQALRRRRPPGAPRRLVAEPLTQVPALVPRGPAAYGFRGQLWTRKRLAEVRRVEFGVVSHPTPVGRLLQALRWSPPKPRRRARPRAEAASAQWRDAIWPALKRGQTPKGHPASS